MNYAMHPGMQYPPHMFPPGFGQMQQQFCNLLFFDNLDHLDDRSQMYKPGIEKKMIDEITFRAPVKVQLIRIVRQNHNCHQKFKKLDTVTQSDKVRQFEIFGKDEYQYLNRQVTSRFKLLFIGDVQADSTDVLIHIEQFITSRLVIRGFYKRLTIAIYGYINHDQLAPFFASNISQVDLEARSRKAIIPDELVNQLMAKTSIYDKIMEIPKQINDRIYRLSNFHLNLDNIQPALLIEDTLSDTQNTIVSLASELQAVDDDYAYIDKKSVALYHEKLEQLGKVLNKHLKRSFAELHQPAHFDDVTRVYKLLPENLVDAAIFGMKNQLSSALRCLTIVNNLLSSKAHSNAFLQKGGLSILLKFLTDSEKNYSHSHFILQLLETIYNTTNHEEFCEALIKEKEDDSIKIEAKAESISSKKKSKKNKKHKSKEKKAKKDKKKKKIRKLSRSRSRSDDKHQRKGAAPEATQTTLNEVLIRDKHIVFQEFDYKQLSGFQIIAYVQSRTEDEKISAACYLILNKLQIFKGFRKLLKYIKKLDVDVEENVIKILEYLKSNWSMHLDMENLLLNYSFKEVVTKELKLEKMRDLAYSVFDQEKTKISNYTWVKDLIQMDQPCISQAMLVWLHELGFINMMAVLMSLSTTSFGQLMRTWRIYDLCLTMLNSLLQMSGGIVLLFQDLQSVKLLIHALETMSQMKLDNDLPIRSLHTVNLIKASASLITVLDHLYIKLLGYEFDNELIALLGEIHRFSEMKDEQSQKANALHLLMRNDFCLDALLYIFNCKDAMEFNEREFEITLLSQIFFNVLHNDDSPYCMLLAERLSPLNRKFIDYINKDKNYYSQPLRLSQVMLVSLLEPYELFISKDTTKALRENFHNKLRFATISNDPDKNKLIEYFAQYDDQRKIHEALKEEFNLIGSFDRPQQTIQFLDGALKIFSILVKVNQNFFVPYFENEVIAGVEFFAKKLATLLGALLSKNIQVEYMTLKINNMGQKLRDYFDISYRTVRLIEQRLQYRVDLGSDTQFHCTDLCKILVPNHLQNQKVEYYICVNKVLADPIDYCSFGVFGENPQSSYGCHHKANEFRVMVAHCLNLCIQLNCYDDPEKHDDPSKQHLGHVQSGQEVQNLFQLMYIRAFKHVEDTHIVVKLMAQLIDWNIERPLVKKNVTSVLFRPMKKIDDEFENFTKQGDLGFMLETMFDLTCFQNLMHATLYSYSEEMRRTFYLLLQTLLRSYDHDIINNLYKIYETIIKNQYQKIKVLTQKEDKPAYNKRRQDWMQRFLFVIQSLEFCTQHPGFGYIFNYEHLDDDIVKLYQLIDDEIEYVKTNDNSQSYMVVLLNVRQQFLQLFSKIVDHENGFSHLIDPNGRSSQYLIEDIPHITHQQALFRQLAGILSSELQLSQLILGSDENKQKREIFQLLAITHSIMVIKNASKNIVGQIIILYSDYSETVFKAKPIFSLHNILEMLINIVNQLTLDSSQFSNEIYRMLINFVNAFTQMVLRLCLQAAKKVFHDGDVRKRALNAIFLGKKGDLASKNKLETFHDLVNWMVANFAFTQNLKQAFLLATYIQQRLQNAATSTSTNDERDTNLSLPNEPRRHEKIFEAFDNFKRRNQKSTWEESQRAPMNKFFSENILELEGQKTQLRYGQLCLSIVTPWKQVFSKQSVPEPSIQLPELVIPRNFHFEQDMFEFVELRIENYPRPYINDIITLIDRTPGQFRERKAVQPRHTNVKVAEAYDHFERRIPLPKIEPYAIFNAPPPHFMMQQQQQHIPRHIEPEPPMPQSSFLEELRPQPRPKVMVPPPMQPIVPQHKQPFTNRPAEDDPRLRRNNSGTQYPPHHNAPTQPANHPPAPPSSQPVEGGEIAEIISSLTEEEKGILKNYLESTDPRRESQLKEYQRNYPGINRFILCLKKQQRQQH